MDQLLTRKLAIKENMDPRGNKWGIGKIKGTALFHIDILEGQKNSGRPKSFEGHFTNATLAQKTIESYLREQWDHNDEVVAAAARKAHAAKIAEEARKEAEAASKPTTKKQPKKAASTQ